MSWNRKLGVLVVFFTGFLGVVSSVVAMYYRIVLACSDDSTWYSMVVCICITIENNITIIAACMPAFANFMLEVGVALTNASKDRAAPLESKKQVPPETRAVHSFEDHGILRTLEVQQKAHMRGVNEKNGYIDAV
ncbi:hypothetical protein HK405_014934 [Cladochytrium tenue]|nr:hypothetical protein HK405_014934 [Cladochytrium tenue]